MADKLFFLDLETTGVDVTKHGIIQIGAIIEIDGKEVDRLNYAVRPFPDDEVLESALKINGITQKDMDGYSEPLSVYRDLISNLGRHIDKYDRNDKFNIVGYNATFDDEFLRAWFKKCGDNYYGSFFSWPPLDIANLLAFLHRKERANFDDFKLMTTANYMGIALDKTKAHDAMYDVEVTRELFWKIEEELGNG